MPNLKDFLAMCPGLAGDVARAVDDSLTFSQPAISLAAGLSFASVLMSGRVVSVEGIEPNLYTFSIAPSGSGKSQAMKAIEKLMHASNLSALILGEPASDAGLLKALAEAPRRLLLWDEFGIALSELSKTSASHRALILATAMNLFSRAGGVYYGRQYAQQARIDIKNPYLNIFAVSTPNRFFSALDEQFVHDGFLSRWLVFHPDYKLEERLDSFPQRAFDPSPFLSEIAVWEEWHPSKSSGNLSAIIEKEKIPIKFNLHKSGCDVFAKSVYQQRMIKAQTDFEKVFWSRAYEQYIKVCMLTSSPTGEFDRFFAENLVTYLIRAQIEVCRDNLGVKSKFQQAKDKILHLIPTGGSITRSNLTRATERMDLKKHERNSIIEDLLESGRWILQRESVDGSSRKSDVFYCVK